jgi:cellulose synthase/poly-beta-1,6-N-acetylglucosamine synthase-like glycosyltransferase
MLGIKAENKASKLDSHKWFFAFAEHFRVDKGVKDMLVFLIDAGTEPQKHSLAMMIHTMETDPQLGGVCGEICIGGRTTIAEGGSEYYCKAIVAAQTFEYKASHLLDKSFESVFGYISVLPGAFSGYRFEAIHPHDRLSIHPLDHRRALSDLKTQQAKHASKTQQVETPLEKYFHSLQEGHTLDISNGNMYLAEDRIICFEMLAVPRRKWQMRYVKGARATVDPVDDDANGAFGGCCSWQFEEETALEGLIKQRRRWINGTVFASCHAMQQFPSRILAPPAAKKTTHSRLHRVGLTIEFAYFLVTMGMMVLLPSVFYLSLYFAVDLAFPNHWALSVFNCVYLGLLATHMVVSLGDEMSRTDQFGKKVARRFMMRKYTLIMHMMGCFMYFILAISIYQIYRLGYQGASTAVLHGYSSMECNVDRFNELFLDCSKPGSFCYQPPPGEAGGAEAHMQAMVRNFQSACTDSNDLWVLSLKEQTQSAPLLTQLSVDATKGTLLPSPSLPRSPRFNFVGTGVGRNRSVYHYDVSIESGSVEKGCSVETLVEIVFLCCCSAFSVFIAAAIHDLDSLLHTGSFSGELRVVCLSFFQYLYILPTFINIILVYAFCNLHDLTWGTKGIEKQLGQPKDASAGERGERGEEASDFKLWRTRILLVLLMANGCFGVYCMSNMDGSCFLIQLAHTTGAYQALKLAASVLFVVTNVVTGRGSRSWQKNQAQAHVAFGFVDAHMEEVHRDTGSDVASPMEEKKKEEEAAAEEEEEEEQLTCGLNSLICVIDFFSTTSKSSGEEKFSFASDQSVLEQFCGENSSIHRIAARPMSSSSLLPKLRVKSFPMTPNEYVVTEIIGPVKSCTQCCRASTMFYESGRIECTSVRVYECTGVRVYECTSV